MPIVIESRSFAVSPRVVAATFITQKRVRAESLLRTVEVPWGIVRGSLDAGTTAGGKPPMPGGAIDG
jgi:hypothetical protein